MMRLIYIAVVMLLLLGCSKKNSEAPTALRGIWVETTLREDTFDFEPSVFSNNSFGYAAAIFNSKPYIDTVLNPNYPIIHSSIYHYYFSSAGNEISLRSMLSSSTAFNNYTFAIQANSQRFSIGKFYNRRALPAVIEFVRIR